jgi:hypothetical protein
VQIKTKIVSCHTADSKPVKQEVNGTVILPLLVFPGRRERENEERLKCVRALCLQVFPGQTLPHGQTLADSLPGSPSLQASERESESVRERERMRKRGREGWRERE